MKVCECELAWIGMTAEEAPICGEFEDTSDDDCYDCCKHCRHGERCHLEE